MQKRISKDLNKKKNFNYFAGASLCAQAIKIQHAIELLETQTLEGLLVYLKGLFKQAEQKKSKGVIKLVSKPEFNLAFIKLNEIISKGIEHPKIKKLVNILEEESLKKNKKKVIIFSQFRRDRKSVV